MVQLHFTEHEMANDDTPIAQLYSFAAEEKPKMHKVLKSLRDELSNPSKIVDELTPTGADYNRPHSRNTTRITSLSNLTAESFTLQTTPLFSTSSLLAYANAWLPGNIGRGA